MMEIVNYQPEKHKDTLITWYKQWEMPVDVNMLSDSGLIIEGICAIFLYKTNSPVCMIENLVCNREAPPEIRQQGLDLLGPAIFKLAQSCGFKQIVSLINNPKVIQRALDFDYKISGDKFYIMIRSFK